MVLIENQEYLCEEEKRLKQDRERTAYWKRWVPTLPRGSGQLVSLLNQHARANLICIQSAKITREYPCCHRHCLLLTNFSSPDGDAWSRKYA